MYTHSKLQTHPHTPQPHTPRNTPPAKPAFMGFSRSELRRLVAAMIG